MMPEFCRVERRDAAIQEGNDEDTGWSAVVLTTGLALCTSTVGAQAAVPTDTSAARGGHARGGARAHGRVQFADLSDGTREASTLGYELSADYVAGLMDAAGYEVTRQSFEYSFYEELAAPAVTGIAGLRSRTPTA